MPGRSAHVKNERQYEALKHKGMSEERAAKLENAKDSSKHGGKRATRGAVTARRLALERHDVVRGHQRRDLDQRETSPTARQGTSPRPAA